MTEIVDQLDVHFAPGPHKAAHTVRLHDICTQDAMLSHVRTLSTTGSTMVAADSDHMSGVTLHVSHDMPLAQAKELIGDTMSGRVGVYMLTGQPTADRVSKVRALLSEQEVADQMDNYGEDYGPKDVNDPDGTPWVPQLYNGHARDNRASLERDSQDHSSYAIVVVSNAHPQAMQVINNALEADPKTTVGAFVRSEDAARLAEFSDTQNRRIGDRFAALCGLRQHVSWRKHPTEMTAVDGTGTNVDVLDATVMAPYGDISQHDHKVVRITNSTLDLRRLRGTAIPLIRGAADGMMLYVPTAPDASRFSIATLLSDSGSMHTAPVATRKDTVLAMSPDDKDALSDVLHWPGKLADPNIGAPLIEAAAAMGDPHDVCTSREVLTDAGIVAFKAHPFRLLGAIVSV